MSTDPPGLIAKDFFLSSAMIEQLELCPASGVFRLAEKPEKVEPWLWWGIFIHRFLEYAQTRGRDAALEYIAQKFPRGLATCRRIDTDAIPSGDVEVALAHDVYERTARQIFAGQKPVVARETYSRADLIFRDPKNGNRPHVVDYKTGDPGSPDGDIQLLGQAAAVADLLGWRREVAVSFVIVKSTGELVWRTVELSADELDEFTERSRKVHLRVMQTRQDYNERGVLPDFIPNSYCTYCALKPACPAHAVQEAAAC